MADFLLSVGVDVGLSFDQMQKDISDLVAQLNQNPQRVRVGLEIDHSAIERFRTEVANIHNTMGGLGRVTVSPVDTAGLNNAIDSISRLAQSTQGAISTVQTMRAELNSVNAERVQQAIASINGISADGAESLTRSLSEANVRATEVRARLLEAADAEQQLVVLQIRGTNEAGHMVNYLMTYNTETSEISRRMVDITARLEDASSAESRRATTVREVTDLYRQMHALMRTNTNAANTASYAELAEQANLLRDALALASTEAISIDEAFAQLGTAGTAAINGARDVMSAFRLEMERTGNSGAVNLTTLMNIATRMQTMLNSGGRFRDTESYTALNVQLQTLLSIINNVNSGTMSLEQALIAAGINGATAIQNANAAMAAFKFEMSGAASGDTVLTEGMHEYTSALDKVNKLLTEVEQNTKKWTAAKNGDSAESYTTYSGQIQALTNLRDQLTSNSITVREFGERFDEITNRVSSASAAIKVAGENTQSFGDRIKSLSEKFSTWFSITRVIMAGFSAIRKMVTAVTDIDIAMTELKKVTDETDAVYDAFLVNASKRAKELGAALSDTVTATADFARLGYGIEDAEKLADAAIVYKNVGDGIDDISEASESIIATMQAFGISAEDAMSIVDKFNEVGNNYAISSEGVGEALLRSAAAMQAANNTLDETIALATAANTIVQNPETVGTTLKTVSMYLRAAKTEAEEAGESTDGMAESVSELRKEILSLTNQKVDIQIDEDTFKSTYQILKELSAVWGDLSDITQANITELVGGKRNSNVVSALLENFSVAEAVLETSAQAAGSALAENEKYLDSINGKVSQFKSTFETFSQNLISSDLVKLIVDIGTAILTVLDGLQKCYLLLPSIITLATIIRGIGLAKQLSITTKTLIANKAATEGLIASVTKLTVAQKRRLVEDIKAAVASGSLTKEQGAQILTTLGLAIADGTLTIANKSLAASFKSLAASVPVWGWISLAISVVIEAILALTSATDDFAEEFESLNEALEQTTSEIKTISDNFSNLKADFDDTVPRFAELASGVNELGKNAKLTDEEYEEFLQLNNKIAEMFPELNLGMDENGNYMIALSYSSDTLKNSLYELLEAQRLVAAQEMAAKMPTMLDDIIEIEKGYKDDIAEIEADIKRIQSGSFIRSTSGDAYSAYADAKSVEEYYDYIEYLTDRGIEVTSDIENVIGTSGMIYTATWDVSSSQVQNALVGYTRQIDDLEAKIKSVWKQSNASVSAWLQSDYLYNDMGSTMQDIAKAMVSGMDFNDLGLVGDSGENTAENIQSYITKYIINPLYSASPEIKTAFETAMSELSDGDITAEEFTTKIKGAFDNLLSGMDDNEIENFKKSFVAGFNAMGIAGTNFDAVVGNLITNWSNSATKVADGSGSMAGSITDLSTALQNLKSAYSLISTAQEEMTNGSISADTINTLKSLCTEEENYLDYLYEENGVVKLNTEAWKENANAKMQEQMAEIEEETESLKEQNAALEEKNRLLYNQVNPNGSDDVIATEFADAYHEYRVEIAENNRVIEENNSKIAENQRKLAIYSSLYDSITGDLDTYTSALNNFSRISNTINSVSDSFQTLADLQAAVADGFTMSLEKALEFAAVYPEILNNATVAADGQLMLNEGVVNEFIAGKKVELDAQINSQIAQLNADKAVLESKLASAQAQLELAKSVGEGEGQISKEVAEHRINTGNALTEALIGMGVEESQAYALAAAAMGEDEEEFARVAKECFENLDENSAKAAYDMAHAIFVNADNSCSSIADIAAQAHETAKAIAAMGDGDIAGSSGSVFGGGDGSFTSGLSLDLYEGTFNGSDYEYEAKTIDLDDYISQIELDISAYKNAISQIDGQIAALEALKDTPLKSFTSDASEHSGSSNKDEVEEYLADIDEYYEALKRLESIQERLSKLQAQIEYADTEEEKIALTKQLINVYDDEADALENLNKLRSETIANGKAELESLGFQVSYDASTNEFMVHNMEHLNELYGATQEETNELRKSTEELIDTMESLNSSNQEGASSLRTLKADIKSAKQAIVDYLKEIVTAASDVVDEYQNVYDMLHSAADEYAASGFITIDTLQSIIELGAQYMQYLMDENGLLVINEENINKVLAAKTQELALNQAMTYVERLRLALQENSIEDLNKLLYATTEATNATWGLVYANLALLGLDDSQYQAALHNINAIRSLADSAISGIGQVSEQTVDELNSMRDGLDDILQYVMDMLKQRVNDQIDALEDMKDAYADIIALRKEALESAKEEADYQDEVAEKAKEIAKLQARINALSLDDSRDAQAQKAQLEEEMAELQKELADLQADYALDAQKDALDDMQDAYEKEKDAEIEVLEDSVSSYQKLYDMAISYIEANWDSLYNELISWNYQYGNDLNSSITTAWDNALAAAQRYGSYVSALNNIGADIDAATGNTPNFTLGATNYDNSASAEEMIHAIIKQMYSNSQAWATAGNTERKRLSESSLELGAQLAQYGITAVRGSDGVWYIDRVGGEALFEKYKNYIYHNGGIVGDEGSLKENELLAKLERGEVMVSNRSKDSLFSLIEFVDMLSKKLDIASVGMMGYMGHPFIRDTKPDLSNITNNQNEAIHFGDVYIYGANEQTVEKHREVTRQFTNEVLRQLNIKR